MIGTINGSSGQYAYAYAVQKKTEADGSFSEAIAQSTDDILMSSAPDRWVSEAGLSANAVKAALAFRKNELGISAPDEPTHELTAQQRAWLDSRHDYATMQAYVRSSYVNASGVTQYQTMATAEYSNLLADLAYLGVCSAEDYIQAAPIDTRAGGNSVLSGAYNIGGATGVVDSARQFTDYLEGLFSFYDERSGDPVKAVKGDAEFAALIREHYLPANRELLKLIEQLFGKKQDEELRQTASAPAIEDCTERLKEEFGALCASV